MLHVAAGVSQSPGGVWEVVRVGLANRISCGVGCFLVANFATRQRLWFSCVHIWRTLSSLGRACGSCNSSQVNEQFY